MPFFLSFVGLLPSRASNRILILLALGICAYIPALRLPFIADDYVLIPMVRHFAAGGFSSFWHSIWQNPDLRTRTTYVLLSLLLDRIFGFTPLPFYAASILLHCACVLLVYASAVWTRLNSSITFWAACFFAIYEGHQEAVMWVAASNELLVFLFGVGAWICWVKWLQGAPRIWYAAALVSFVLALASKESAWIVPVLMFLPVALDYLNTRGWRRACIGLAPFFTLSILFAGFIVATRMNGGHFDDRFSLVSNWPVVLLRSFGRLLFVWGLVAIAILAVAGKRTERVIGAAAAFWMLAGLLPYSFLTYMPQVPSRHTYLASAGLAMLVGTAMWRLQQQKRRALLAIGTTAALAINLEILWIKKMAQYRERAEPSELLKQAAEQANGPIRVNCTPLNPAAVRAVLENAHAQGIYADSGARDTEHCFSIEYRNRLGEAVAVNLRLGRKHGVFY